MTYVTSRRQRPIESYDLLCIVHASKEIRIWSEKTLHMCFDKWTDDNQSNRNILHHYHVHFHKIDHEVLISIQQNNPPRPEQIVHGLLRYTKRIKF